MRRKMTDQELSKLARVKERLAEESLDFTVSMSRLEHEMCDEWPAAATDGRTVFYHPDYFREAPIADLVVVEAHEIGHCKLVHPARMGKRDKELFSVATDRVDNALLLEAGFKLPRWMLKPLPGDGARSAESLYHEMLEQQQESAEQGEQGEQGDGADSGEQGEQGDGADSGEQGEQGDGSEQGEQDDSSSGRPGSGRAVPAWKPGDPVEDLGQVIPAPDVHSQEDLANEVARWNMINIESANMYRTMGKSCGYLEERISREARRRSDLQEVLSAWCSNAAAVEYKQLPPRRSLLYMGMYLSTYSGASLPFIAILVDTSGSVTSAALETARNVINGVLADYPGTPGVVVAGDTAVCQEIPFTGELPELDSWGGRGGTDFRPMYKHVAENYAEAGLIVHLTDTYGDWPEREPDCPVIVGMWSEYGAPYSGTPKWVAELVPISVSDQF